MGGAERVALLQSLSVRLAAVTDPAAVAATVLGEGLERLGADSGSICVLDPQGETLEIVAASGYESDVIGAWTTFPVDADLPASVAARTGRAVFLESSIDRNERYPIFRSTPVVDDEAVACLPLRTADGDLVGVLVLGFGQPREFTEEDERFLDALCVHAATALARTTGRIQLMFLAEASSRLAMSLDLDQTLRTIGELAVPRLADAAEVSRVEEDRVATTIVGGATVDGDRGDPISVVLPLRARSRLVGALALTNAPDRPFSRTDRLLASELAARGAVAIDNAQLFAAQQHQREAAESAEHRLRELNELMLADRHRIQQLVSALQRSLLPPQLPEIPGAELSACYLPGMLGLDVGGDFYDVFDTGGDWAMVIGDVCGKGPEAAALTAVARSTIRSVAMDLRQPSQVLRKLNDALHRQDLDERFCTIAYTRVVPIAHGLRVTVCRGGHTAPLIRRVDGRIEPIGAIGPLIGIFPEVRVWDETAVLEAGDALVLYTDGVTEARANGTQFGDERLWATLRDCDASSADAIAQAIERGVLAFCGEPTDDTAVLVLRVKD